MSALPDLVSMFHALERLVEAMPEGTNAEIIRGVYSMTPRPRVRHSVVHGNLYTVLRARLGGAEGSVPPDWLFLLEPEIRSESAFSRLIPDVAGWRRSTTGWPGLDDALIERMPEWVAEVVSEGAEKRDREQKREAYGLMGVGWLWIVDPVARTVEVHANERGRMNLVATLAAADTLAVPPFDALEVPVASLFAAE